MTRIFHAPSSDSAPFTVRLLIDPGHGLERILLNDLPVAWCKIDSRLDCDVTTLLQPTNRLAVELTRTAALTTGPSSDNHNTNPFIQPPFEAWLEITNP